MAKKDMPREQAVMEAEICSVENGLETYQEVSFIRIKSRRYTLLIMKEYMPVIGEIEGDVTISCSAGEIEKKGVCGFFKHQHNHFSLMLKGRLPGAEKEEEQQEEAEHVAE